MAHQRELIKNTTSDTLTGRGKGHCPLTQLTHINTPRLVVRMLTGWYVRESIMKKLILIAALTLVSHGAMGDWAVKGEGNFNCPEYLSAKRSNSAKLYSSASWVQGFITGVNYQRAQDSGSNSLIGQDMPAASIVRWLRNHCEENLQDDLADAAVALVKEQQTEKTTITQSPDDHSPDVETPIKQSSGTCFFVDGFGTAVTNNHVIDGYSSIEIIAANGTKSSATIIKASNVLDVAILATGLQTSQFLTLASNGTLSLGQDVFTIGFPVTNLLGDKPKYSEGTISALSGLNNDDSWIQMSTPIQPGNSGGPLVDLAGQVVGVVTATAAVERFFSVTGSLPQNINWAIKAKYARALIPETSTNTHLSNKQEVIAHTEKSVCRVIAR